MLYGTTQRIIYIAKHNFEQNGVDPGAVLKRIIGSFRSVITPCEQCFISQSTIIYKTSKLNLIKAIHGTKLHKSVTLCQTGRCYCNIATRDFYQDCKRQHNVAGFCDMHANSLVNTQLNGY